MNNKDGTGWDSVVVMTIEPSKELSKMIGSPYLIQKCFTLRDLFQNGVITKEDIDKMKKGETLTKKIKGTM